MKVYVVTENVTYEGYHTHVDSLIIEAYTTEEAAKRAVERLNDGRGEWDREWYCCEEVEVRE